jgi:hypothetical protein
VKAELGAKTREAKDKGKLDTNARLARLEKFADTGRTLVHCFS